MSVIEVLVYQDTLFVFKSYVILFGTLQRIYSMNISIQFNYFKCHLAHLTQSKKAPVIAPYTYIP